MMQKLLTWGAAGLFSLNRCLLILILFILLAACSRNEQNKGPVQNWGPYAQKTQWFSTKEVYTRKNRDDVLLSHLFFDLDPQLSAEHRGVNFVVTTPSWSRARYEIDMKSGRLYKDHEYCKHFDVWRKYQGRLELPVFTRGFVPRILDQTGKAQQIIVFGREEFYEKHQGQAAHRVRIVGGLSYQYCPVAPCTQINAWQTSQLLVAVDPQDSRFEKVFTVSQLEKKVRWPYVLGFLQNADGVNRFNGRYQAAYRINRTREANTALNYLLKHARMVTVDDMQTIRKACEKLYDFTWETFAPKFENEDKKINFGERFKVYDQKVGEQFLTCTDMVAYHDHQENRRAHWVLSYLEIFYRLRELGYTYLCAEKQWIYNPKYKDGRRLRALTDDIKNCRDEQLEAAFSAAVEFIAHIKDSGEEHFRYVEYDSAGLGSKQRLYSWLKVSGKKMLCELPEESVRNQDYVIFPHDVKWKSLK